MQLALCFPTPVEPVDMSAGITVGMRVPRDSDPRIMCLGKRIVSTRCSPLCLYRLKWTKFWHTLWFLKRLRCDPMVPCRQLPTHCRAEVPYTMLYVVRPEVPYRSPRLVIALRAYVPMCLVPVSVCPLLWCPWCVVCSRLEPTEGILYGP